MTKRRAVRILLTVVCVALAALLGASAAAILREGVARKAADPLASVYTPRIVAEKLAPVAPLFVALIVLTVAARALGVKAGDGEEPARDAACARAALVARVAVPSDAMRRERAAQKKLRLAGGAAFALCMIPVALHLADPAHFPQDDPEAMLRALLGAFLPWTAAGIGALAAAFALGERSARREADAARARLREEREAGVALEAPAASPAGCAVPRPSRGRMAAILIAAAALLIVAGVLNGGARDVLYKAITICTECVGLG